MYFHCSYGGFDGMWCWPTGDCTHTWPIYCLPLLHQLHINHLFCAITQTLNKQLTAYFQLSHFSSVWSPELLIPDVASVFSSNYQEKPHIKKCYVGFFLMLGVFISFKNRAVLPHIKVPLQAVEYFSSACLLAALWKPKQQRKRSLVMSQWQEQ